MKMNGLRARLVERVTSDDGPQAVLVLTEPNGDEYTVRCLCKQDGTTDLGGRADEIAFLNLKYGQQTIWALSRQITLGQPEQ